MRLAAALLAGLVSVVIGPNAALPAAGQHHDQAPGFYRLKVGDLEVTALFEGTGVFDPHWLNGPKATMDGVLKALHDDAHLLDVADTGFLVNTGMEHTPGHTGYEFSSKGRNVLFWGDIIHASPQR